MAVAIYYGEVEIAKILEEKGIEKGDKAAHIEAAILSYRNAIVKEIINHMKEKNENEKNLENILKIGLIASIKSNNIKGFEMLINKGAKIKESQHQTGSHFKTFLHYAAHYNSKEIGEILISKGADINAKDIIYQIMC